MSYGPQGLAGDQPLVVVRNAAGEIVAQAGASPQQVAGTAGVRLELPGLGEIVVGERPRARGANGPARAGGTGADAAVDLVRINLLGQDIRLGHMEAAVTVPPAGVTCPGLEVTVTPTTGTAAPGDTLDATVKVRNPNEGNAAGVAINTTIAADPGIDARPGAVSFNNKEFAAGLAGLKLTTPLGPGQAVTIPMAVRVVGASGPGAVRLSASATGHYGDGPLGVPTAGGVTRAVTVTPAAAPPAPAGTQNPVGGKAAATAGAPSPAGSGGRKPSRASAGVSGAAGLAASAAPATPAPTSPAPAATAPTPPVTEPAPSVAVPPPAQVPSKPAERAFPALKGKPSRHTRWAWVGGASLLIAGIGAAIASRFLRSNN